LAPKDGPYGFLQQHEWYEPNPGLVFWNRTRADNLKIGFQPELGSVSTPSYDSMLRFMPVSVIANYPNDNLFLRSVQDGKQAPQAQPEIEGNWTYHKFIPYNGCIASYGPISGTTEQRSRGYCFRAQLCQFVQYKGLFEGFQAQMWSRCKMHLVFELKD
jgi:hypothetical protein